MQGSQGFVRSLQVLAMAGLVSAWPPPLSDEAPAGTAPAPGPGAVARSNSPARAEADEPPAGLTRSDWIRLRRTVEASQYHASPVAKPGEPSALQAPNREQGYHTTFRPEGIEIAPRGADGTWHLGVSVTGYGYAGDVRPLQPAAPKADKERVEYHRGNVTEWYVNRPGGLEQGFELAEPEPRRDEPLVVAMAVRGDLEVAADGDGASFRSHSGGTVVRYGGPKAWYAEGRTLRSRLEAAGREVRVVVDAQAARFPVTVDPTFVHEAKLVGQSDPIGQAGAEFGTSVSVSGDTAVVGAYLDDTPGGINAGSAYVFVRSGTTWTEQQKLLASDGAPGDLFGSSVSVSGDTVVVGAYRDDTPGGVDVGSAYVFVRSGATWSEEQKLTASDGAPSDNFGDSVSVSGGTVVVGASRDDISIAGDDSGSAHVFRAPTADLGVTKTDGVPTVPPGGGLTYTVAVSNAGPAAATGATIADVFPAALTCTTTCAGTGGATCTPGFFGGNINDTLNIPAGQSVTYTSACTVSAIASGTLSNTATVAAPSTVIDPEPVNNSATDVDAVTPQADLSVTKTDGQATAVPGQPVTYTIMVANGGPHFVAGATVTDNVPAVLQGATWSCSASPGSTCTTNGAGSIHDTVNLLVGGTLTYSLIGTVDPTATGTLVNTATVAVPAGGTDPDPANNSATDTDTLLPAVLSIEGELSHGTSGWHDLAALPGPAPDEDLFRILQRPHGSYEVLQDGASGDIGSGSGPLLDRVASDGSTVLQSSSPAGAGGSRSLRFMNALDTPVADELVRVQSAGCTTDCDAEDVYRLNALETTGFIPRFNNSGTQITILVLQNLGDAAIDLDVRFWNGAGAPAGSLPIQTLGPRGSYVLNTLTVAGGSSGSVTVANTGRYGQLAGKAVAVEPATGFTFDTQLQPRPR